MRAKRSLLHVLTGFGSTLITMIVGLFATPIIVKYIGPESYGLYRTILDAVGYLTILELGLNDAIIPIISRTTSARVTVRSSVDVFIRVTLVKLVGAVAMALFGSLLVQSSTLPDWNLRAAFLVGSFNLIFTPIQAYKVYLDTRQLGLINNLALTLQSLTATFFSLVFAVLGYGLLGQFAAGFLGSTLYHLAIYVRAKKHLRSEICEKNSVSSESEIRSEIWKLNRPQLVASVCSRLSLTSDSLIVSYFLGPTSVASFFLTQRLVNSVLQQLFVIGNSTWAALHERRESGHRELFVLRLLQLTRLVVMVGFCLFTPLFAFNRNFISVWVGADHYAGDTVTFFSGINSIFLALTSLWVWNFSSTGLAAKVIPQYVVFTIINFALSCVLSYLGVVAGPLIGTTVACLLVSMHWIPKLLQENFNVPKFEIYKAVWLPFFCNLPLLFGGWFWASSLEKLGWMNISISMIFVFIIVLSYNVAIVLPRKDREEFFMRIRQRM